MKFNPSLHTFEARAEQIRDIQSSHPGAILMGSVARHALMGEEASVSKGYFNNTVRDLDFTTTGTPLELTEVDQSPFPVDDLLMGLINVDHNRDIATVLFESSRPDVAVELPSSVFDPYPISVGGIRAQTFHPDVMRRLHLIMNSNRSKDRRSIAAFETGLAKVDFAKIPDKTFEPLHDLGRMVLSDPALRRQRVTDRLQEVYSEVIPDSVRNGLKPVVGTLKKTVFTSRY